MRGSYTNFVDLSLYKAIQLQDMTPWVPYTPTLTGFGIPTNVNFRSRRIMDALSVFGTFRAGTVSGTEARISLGFNGTDGNVTSLLSLPTLSYCGDARTDGLADMPKSMLIEPGKTYMTIGNSGALIIPLVKALANLIIGNNGTISFAASIPIEEWKTQ